MSSSEGERLIYFSFWITGAPFSKILITLRTYNIYSLSCKTIVRLINYGKTYQNKRVLAQKPVHSVSFPDIFIVLI